MKRTILIILVVCLTICGLPFSSNAESGNKFYLDGKDITIINDGNSLSNEKIETIAAVLARGSTENDNVSTYSLLCVFGHKIEYSKALVIDHNYYSTSPYCRESEYEVETCARESCSYMKNTLVVQYRTADCHG